ncbi:MAG: WD40 repeat domain-containing protein [bacterium]
MLKIISRVFLVVGYIFSIIQPLAANAELSEDNNLLWKKRIPGVFEESSSINIDESMILVANKEGDLYLFDEEGKMLWQKRFSEEYKKRVIYTAAAISNKNYVAISLAFDDYTNKLLIFNSQQRLIGEFEGRGGPQFSADGRYLLVIPDADEAGELEIWKISENKVGKVWESGPWQTFFAVISPHGKYVFTDSGTLYDVEKKEVLWRDVFWGHIGSHNNCFYVSESGQVMAGYLDERLLYFVTKEGVLRQAKLTTYPLAGAAISDDGKFVATLEYKGKTEPELIITSYDGEWGKYLWGRRLIKAYKNRLLPHVEMSSNGDYILVSVSSESVSGENVFLMNNSGEIVQKLRIDCPVETVVTWPDDKKRIWRILGRKINSTVSPPYAEIYLFEYSLKEEED